VEGDIDGVQKRKAPGWAGGENIGYKQMSISGYWRARPGRAKRSVRVRGHTRRGWVQDQRKRSSQPWERGARARRKGNPRFKPVRRRGRKVYILRRR